MHAHIRGEEGIYGFLSVGNDEPRSFEVEEQRLFAALAQRAAIAIEQAQLQHQAQKTAVYEERQRLARDLHDAVTQTLFSASLISEVLPKLWEIDEEAGRDRLVVLNELTRGALAEMRMLLLELRPSAIEQADLDDLLDQLVTSAVGRARIPIELNVEGDCKLGPEAKVELYRITQEALNNIIKHANASFAEILANCEDQRVVLRIRDNGVGFNPDTVAPERLGLGIMKERVERIGGSFELNTEPEKGTEIVFEVPYEREANRP
jgi:signal transduction histidine kinase